jgi:hypothetical protein
VPKFPESLDGAVRHPSAELLHDVELRHRDDLYVISPPQQIAVEGDRNLANGLLPFGQVPDLQIPVGEIGPAQRVRGVSHVIVHQTADMVAGVEPAQEPVDLTDRRDAPRLGLDERAAKGDDIAPVIAVPTNGNGLTGDISDFYEPPDWPVELARKFPRAAHELEIGVVEHHGVNLRPDLLIKPF